MIVVRDGKGSKDRVEIFAQIFAQNRSPLDKSFPP
jgi:hypothetical protein